MSVVEEKLARLTNPTLEFYLGVMADTESPALMHAWGLISAASACLTRRKWFPLGPLKVYPNQFIMLVGPPGTRKSAAISFAKSLVENIDGMRFGPNNTAGRSQGLVSAMLGVKSRVNDEAEAAFADALSSAGGALNFGIDGLDEHSNHALNRSALYCAESELVGFLGRQCDEFITFLGDMWDCPEKHETSLKRETTLVHFPCINILGGITPMHITTYLPAQAIGQGFSSRVIMVYQDEGKKIAWPEPIDADSMKQLQRVMSWIYNLSEGPFEYEPAVKVKVKELYSYKLPIEDIRFLHYAQRRQSHMLKVAMALAVLRMSEVVSADDVQDAHDLLVLTESFMTSALGEYGMTPAALAKARVGEVLRANSEPMTALRITLACGSDVKQVEVQRAIFEMAQSGQIIELHLKDPTGQLKIGYVWPREMNAFKRHAEVAVPYLLDTEQHTKKRHDASHEQDPPRQKQAAVDNEQLEAALAEVELPASDLTEQGYGSVMDKLRGIVALQSVKQRSKQ